MPARESWTQYVEIAIKSTIVPQDSFEDIFHPSNFIFDSRFCLQSYQSAEGDSILMFKLIHELRNFYFFYHTCRNLPQLAAISVSDFFGSGPLWIGVDHASSVSVHFQNRAGGFLQFSQKKPTEANSSQ
jgi:hypothetical protein